MAAASSSFLSWSSSFLPSSSSFLFEGTLRREPSILAAENLKILAQKKAKKTRKIFLKEDVLELGKRGGAAGCQSRLLLQLSSPIGQGPIRHPSFAQVKEEAQQLTLVFQTGSFQGEAQRKKRETNLRNVTAHDIIDIIKAQLNRDIDKRIVSLPDIRETGEIHS